MQSKAFERSVRTAAACPPESRDRRQISIIAIKQRRALNPFRIPDRHFEKDFLGRGKSGSA